MSNTTPTSLRLLYCIILVHVLLPTLNSNGSASSNGIRLESVSLQLKWKHQFQFAGYYAAVEKGYYRDFGLNVKIIEGGIHKNSIEEVLSNTAQFGISNSELLLHRLQDKPVVVLAAIFQHSPLALVTRKKTGYDNPQSLIGKRVKMTRHSRDIELHAMFLAEGISLDDFVLLDGPNKYEQYFDDKIDAISAYLTNEPFHYVEKSVDYNVISPRTYGIDFYGDCLFTSEQELKDHPERVRAFRSASLKGWKYAFENSEEIIELILRKYRAEKKREHLQYEAEMMKKLILPNLVELGHMNPGRWGHIAKTFQKFDLVDQGYSLEGFIYNPQSNKSNTWIYWTLTVVFALGIFSSFVAFFQFRFNKRLKKEIDERKQAEQLLKESENRFRLAGEAAYDLVWEWDIETDSLVWFGDVDGILGFEKGEISFDINSWLKLIHPEDMPKLEKAVEHHRTSSELISYSYRVKNSKGEWRYWDDRALPFVDDKGNPIKWIGVCTDVTNQTEAEYQLKTSLKEKETLLQEIHHRVKNNMQVIASLLELQADKSNDDDLRRALKESQGRVYAMSAVHESLYGSDNLAEIDLKSYLNKIAHTLVQSYQTYPSKIHLNVLSDEIKISIEKANPLGLIINELLSNSLKYAFPDGQLGTIQINMTKVDANSLNLVVSDDGVGIGEDIDWKRPKTLGLQLVRTLIEKQLDGSIELENKPGTSFHIKFSLEGKR